MHHFFDEYAHTEGTLGIFTCIDLVNACQLMVQNILLSFIIERADL
jgi:hypothetical protein